MQIYLSVLIKLFKKIIEADHQRILLGVGESSNIGFFLYFHKDL